MRLGPQILVAGLLFSVWLGKQPVDDDLKKGMLGAP